MQKSRNQKSTLAPIHEIFPLEIIEMVLKNLDYESLCFARRTCRQWQKIIDNFKLLKTASCKYISINISNSIFLIKGLIISVRFSSIFITGSMFQKTAEVFLGNCSMHAIAARESEVAWVNIMKVPTDHVGNVNINRQFSSAIVREKTVD